MFFCQPRNQDFTYTIHFDLREIKKEWDAILPENHHLKSPELLAFQESGLEGFQFAYVLVYKEKKSIGLAYLQIVNFEKQNLPPDFYAQDGASWLRNMMVPDQISILICGHVFRINFPGFYFVQPDQEKFLPHLLLDVECNKLLKNRPVAVLIKDLSAQSILHESLNHKGFKVFKNDIQMDLALSPAWDSFENYLSGISKKYRQRALKIIQQGKEIETRELDLSEIETLEKDLYGLYLQVLEKQQFKVAKLPFHHFLNMKKVHGDRFKVFGYFKDSVLLAFSSHILKAEDKMELYYIGFDQKANEDYALYFNILFDGLEAAISLKKSVLELGRTSLDAKANLGAKANQPIHLFRVKKGIPSFAFRFASKWSQNAESQNWKKRNPLKAEQEAIQLMDYEQN